MNSKLGIFYSNNDRPETKSAINSSLQSIKIAAKDEVDIITCMWYPQTGNPFTELLAWTRTQSHLNQVLQILQLLYFAKKHGNYKYVSFLEHDVLYPEHYFNYPEFSNGEAIVNVNYGGIGKYGFQEKIQHDLPLHQWHMTFIDAINHFESILPNAILTNDGVVEPQNIKVIRWNSEHMPLHINHGHHFTSHFSTYSSSTYAYHPYWKEFEQFKNLFSVK